MSVSKTLVKFRTRKKTNSSTQEIVRSALKQKAWSHIAQILSASTRSYSSVNLEEIDKATKAGDIVVIPGKILSSGELTKKVRICALGISSSAKDKLKETKSEFVSILDEIKKNPKAEGLKILR